MNYESAGVSLNRADALVKDLQALTHADPNVIGGIGDFGALYRLGANVLVAATDGVGTKLKIAQLMNVHDTIGRDLVAMSVNDILTKGAKPLFFLDYFVTGKLDREILTAVVTGIEAGCREAGCSLVGGETAEHPGTFPEGEYDLAGFAVGVVPQEQVIDGGRVRSGDALIALPSSGVHSNGFSLVRHLFFDTLGWTVDTHPEALSGTLGATLLTPTRIYADVLLPMFATHRDHVHGLAHITGGGLTNVGRINQSFAYIIDTPLVPARIFTLIQEKGKITDFEMYRTFNMGMGMVLATDAPEILLPLCPPGSQAIGRVEDGTGLHLPALKITYE